MPSSIAHHEQAARWARCQRGVVSRSQLISAGWTPAMVRAQVASRRWQLLLRGVYLTTTGEPAMPAWWWAAHLFAGPGSYLTGDSALQAWKLSGPALPVVVGVPAGRKTATSYRELVMVRHRTPRPTRESSSLPPAARVEYAVLDAISAAGNPEVVADLVTRACQRGATHPELLARALRTYPRLRYRREVEGLLAEVRDGSTSVLEVDAVRLVLRAHGLPTGTGQVRESQSGRSVVRDRVLSPYGIVLEFDGIRGHADPRSRLRDHRRDNAVIMSGRTSLRFGWADVHQEPCESAAQIAQELRKRGWTGQPTRCSEGCQLRA